MSTLRWGIIGPGAIARDFHAGLQDSAHGTLAAIATRDPSRPGLADRFPGARIVEGYRALLDDPDIDAVYIAVPHPAHAEWAIKAAEAGKHALVEKPLALSAAEVEAVFHAHRRAGTFAGEAFMYRLHPLATLLGDLIRFGTIGEVRMIQSSFGFQMPGFDPTHRLFASDLAGGGIMDVGGYPVSMVRYLAGCATGSAFADPVKVTGTARLNAERTDDWAAALLTFDSGIVAQVSCAVFVRLDNVLRIHGSDGRMEVRDFWFAGGDRRGGPGTVEIIRGDVTESRSVGPTRHLYAFEADAVAEAVRDKRQEFKSPGMSWADSIGNAQVLDAWRKDAGVEFSVETSVRRINTLANRPLGPNAGVISKRAIRGITKPVSTLALGFEDFRSFASGAVLLDAFWERGGNIFDTAYVYGAGYTERLLGEWHRSRGTREAAVIIGKGAHSPLCYPDVIAKQLTQSLERLQTDYVDVYFMHRDNPEVPVGEFVDAMDAEVRAGRIRGPFGGSNWTRQRFDEAIDYARRTGKTEPSALSNNFALARMLEPIWTGCVTSSSADWVRWLAERQISNFSWSSQARGFFTDRAGPDKRSDPELTRVWYDDLNFARRERAVSLARELGKAPIHVALAYVLAQPFASVPLIGPRTLAELDDSLQALSIKLTPEQVGWLEHG